MRLSESWRSMKGWSSHFIFNFSIFVHIRLPKCFCSEGNSVSCMTEITMRHLRMLHELLHEKSDSKHQFRNPSDIDASTRTMVLLGSSVASISLDTLILDSKLTLRGIEKINTSKRMNLGRANYFLYVNLRVPAMFK